VTTALMSLLNTLTHSLTLTCRKYYLPPDTGERTLP